MTTEMYLLEELDDDTRGYLLAVRDNRGKGMPGVYVPNDRPTPMWLLAVGGGIAFVTLLFTLTTWLGVIHDDPLRVALLQTAVLVAGGWVASLPLRDRLRANRDDEAGRWLYADPLNVYEAAGERVIVSPTDAVRRADFEHHDDAQGNYQRTTIALRGRKKDEPLELVAYNASRAERLVDYLEYLSWARGPEGGGRADLPPEDLAALAAYAVKHGEEPLDDAGNPDPARGLRATRWGHPIPLEPQSVRKARPNFIPYVVLLGAAVVCFFVMWGLNTPLRDGAIYDAVTTEPTEPRYLRAYLADPRNTAHRDDVSRRLAAFYEPAILALLANGPGPLRVGLAEVLAGARTAPQPIVSIRVTEETAPAGSEAGSAARTTTARVKLSTEITKYLNQRAKPIVVPPGMAIDPPPAPVGEQLLAFIEAPGDAPGAHIDIRYRFEPTPDGQFRVVGRVELRAAVGDKPAGVEEVSTPGGLPAANANQAVEEFVNLVVAKMTQN